MNFTFDPLDMRLLLIHGIWFVLAAVLFGAAYKSQSGWVKASLGGFALAIVGIELLAVLPSWWLYFADAKLHWGGQGCSAINPGTPDGLQCIKQAVKDTVVVIENAAILGAFVVGFMMWQRKFPKQLAPGEAKGESTGGYR